MVSFAEPARLWLLLLPAATAALVWWRHERRRAVQRRLASPAVWDRLLGGVPATGLVRLLTWCLAGALLVVALARPQWGELPVDEPVRTRDLVMAVDVSDSMRCPDLEPSRLQRALTVLQRALPGLAGNRVGVVVFAGDAYPLLPLTTDVDAVGTFLSTVEPGMVALPGSNLQRAVTSALHLLPDRGEGRVVILVSDGENLQGDPGQALSALKDGGARLVAVVAGTSQGGPIPVPEGSGGVHYKRNGEGRPVITRADRATMQRLADAAGGTLVTLGSPGAAEDLVRAVAEVRARAVAGSEHHVRRAERFQVFLAAAATLLLLGFAASPWRRRAAAVALLLAVVVPVPTAGAAQTQARPGDTGVAAPSSASQPGAPGDASEPTASWWQRLVPGGSRRLARAGMGRWREGDLPGAAKDFAGAAELDPQDPDRLYDLGTALAAQGNVQRATPVLAAAHRAGSTRAAYNLGTAALKRQQADAAVRWLREALLRAPEDADAKRNYELALKLQKQQQDQKQQRDQKRDQKQDDQKKEQQPHATPTPSPTPGPPARPTPQGRRGEATPTPTPVPHNPLYGALERAEARARAAMRRPTPRHVTVEKDW